MGNPSGKSLPQTLPGANAKLGNMIGADGVTFDAIKLLHRPGDGDHERAFVTLHVKVPPVGPHDTGFRNVTSWRVDDIDALLPFAREYLTANAYHSLNAFYRAGREWETDSDGRRVHRRIFAPGLLPVYRGNKAASLLNGIYVDLDCYAVGRTPGEALGAAFDMQLAGTIPNVSVFWFSGQGLWLLWLLRDKRAGVPENPDLLPASQRAWPEALDLYARVERAVARTFEAWGVDSGAKDAARVMRLAGSVNTKAGERVRVLPQIVDGRVPVYTLQELAAHWHVEVPEPIRQAFTVPPLPARDESRVERPRRPRVERDPNRPRDPNKQRAARARWQYALADFNRLRQLRGGRFAHMRQNACFVLALLLRRNQVGPDGTREQVLQLARDCGLEPCEAEHAIAQSGRYATGNPSGRYFADLLAVTPAEAAQLAKWPAANEQPSAPAVLTPRTTRERRAALLEYVQNYQREHGGARPSIRAATAHLTSVGFPVSHAAVHADFLHFDWRGRRGRPPLSLPFAASV